MEFHESSKQHMQFKLDLSPIEFKHDIVKMSLNFYSNSVMTNIHHLSVFEFIWKLAWLK